jgi:PIN domain nuclease of toxin-antitoxin system
MPAVVVDTHTIVWYLSADPRLSANAADALDSATAAGGAFMCHRFVSLN